MKKRMISMILTLAMVLALFPQVNFAAAPEGTPLSGDLGSAFTISENGAYYLATDVVTGNITIAEGAVVTLDLNGKVLDGNDAGSVITINGTLSITDSAPSAMHTDDTLPAGGVITGGKAQNGGGVYIGCDAVFEMDHGSIYGNEASDNGGGVYIAACRKNSGTSLVVTGEFTCAYGKIIANKAGSEGGGLYIACDYTGTFPASGQAVMEHAEVSGNEAACGGGVGMGECGQLLLKSCNVTENTASVYGGAIYKPGVYSDSYDGDVEKCVLLDTEITKNSAGVNGGGVYFQKSLLAGCYTAGTKITMADGTVRNIEDIAVGDEVKTFDHESGTVSSAKVYIAWKEETKPQITFKLHFEGGMSVHCVAADCFLEKETRKYQTLTEENAGSYVGKSFYGEDGDWHKLENVSIEEYADWIYEVYSEKHQNAFTNGMLSLPADVDFLLNIYELDENLKADEAQLAADIETYGLLSCEEAADLAGGMSEEWFEAAAAKYVNIALGKGLVTIAELEDQCDSVDDAEGPGALTAKTTSGGAITAENVTLTEKEPKQNDLSLESVLTDAAVPSMKPAVPSMITSAPPMMTAVPSMTTSVPPVMMLTADVPDIEDYTAGYLTIGSGTQITDNILIPAINSGATAERENVFLGDKITHSDNVAVSLICLAANAKNVIVGVTTYDKPTSDTAIQFTRNGSKSDEVLFFSDKDLYADKYNEAGYLELVLSPKVTEDSCEHGSVNVGYAKSYYTGETVTVKAEADTGYKPDTVEVYKTGDENTKIAVTDGASAGTYTFTMPACDVTITGTFKSFHTHVWTYAEGSSGKKNTITATCTAAGHTGAPEVLTISAPALTTYGEAGKSEKAILSAASLGSLTVSEGSIRYYAKSGDSYAATPVSAPTKAGMYKAEITVNDGTKNLTAYVEYSIAPKQLTLSGTEVSDKEYDGTTSVSVQAGTLNGIAAGDTVSIASAAGSFDSKNAGIGKTVTISYQLAGSDAANYIASETASADILPKQLTISDTTVSDKEYDDTIAASAVMGNVNGVIAGDDVTVTISSASFCDKSVGDGKDVTVSYSVSGSAAGNYIAPADDTLCASIVNGSRKAPTAPSKSDETIKGKADGKLTGLDSTMEYRKAGESTYTAVSGTEVTGLAAGEYKVRYAAKTNYNASPDQTLVVAAGRTLTVSFDTHGGDAVDPVTDVCWQETIELPETAKNGYTFKEWNTEADGSGSKLTGVTAIQGSATYHAIWTANTYTVVFSANGAAGAVEPRIFTYDKALALPENTFVRSGYQFAGWATTADAMYAEFADGASVKNLTGEADGNVVLYALWSENPVNSISGNVQQETAAAPAKVSDALVELRQGQDVVASTRTDANGEYLFTGIAAGEYNLVVTGSASGTESKTRTTLIVLESGNKTCTDVLLPRGNVSSVVEVKDNTPKVVVGGLDDEAMAQAGADLSDMVRFVLVVESVDDVTGDPDAPASEIAAQTAIKQTAFGKTVEFIDMDITKYVNTVDSAVHEVGNVLEIIVPYETAGKNDLSVYRFHDADGDGVLDAGQQISMTRLNARPVAPYTDNTYYVGDGYIAIYTKYFSAYAIGYSTNTGRSPGRKSADSTDSADSADGADSADSADSASVAELLEKARLCPQDETCVYAPFADADPTAWYHDGVHFCVEKGYMKGVGGNRFAPYGTLSRAMVVTILWNMEGQPVVNYAMSFSDVDEDQWYGEAVRWAQSAGVVKGHSDLRFGPDDAVTREQLATILMQYSAFKGIDVSARADLAKYTDAGTISPWAVEYVRWANAEGIINGRSAVTLAPTGNATRAEAACMIKNFCDKGTVLLSH